MQISLDWAGLPLSLPTNVPPGGIPVTFEFKGWPTATSPLEVHLVGMSSANARCLQQQEAIAKAQREAQAKAWELK
jgi:hypothetical protein